jgi:hypothetical protein
MDIAILAAKMVIGELYEEWHNSYLGRRAERVRNAQTERMGTGVQAAEYGNAAVPDNRPPV